MGKIVELNQKHIKFCEEYAKSLNGMEAYKIAYTTCKKDEAAMSGASRLLSDVKIQEYIQSLSNTIQSDRIMSIRELQEFWSDFCRNTEVKDNDRLKASELLGKSKGAFLDRVEATVSIPKIEIKGVKHGNRS